MLLLQLLLHLRGLFSSAGAWTSFHLNSLCSQSTVALLANDVTHEASQRFEIRVPTCLRVFTVHIKDSAAASWLAISTRAAEKQLSAKWSMTKKIIQWNKYTSVKTHTALDEYCTTLHQQQIMIKNLNHDKNKHLHFYHWIYCIRPTSKS